MLLATARNVQKCAKIVLVAGRLLFDNFFCDEIPLETWTVDKNNLMVQKKILEPCQVSKFDFYEFPHLKGNSPCFLPKTK